MLSFRLTPICAALVFTLSSVTPVIAAEENADIPKKPSAPPALGQKIPVDSFKCQRFFVYQGKMLLCDSNLAADAERLRPIIKDVPQSLAELDSYQLNRKNLRNAAYIGTFGLVAAIVTFAVIPKSQPNLKAGLPLIGLGILGGSVLYGLSVLRTNEAHISNAVQYYNDSRPSKPIELQFSTGIIF